MHTENKKDTIKNIRTHVLKIIDELLIICIFFSVVEIPLWLVFDFEISNSLRYMVLFTSFIFALDFFQRLIKFENLAFEKKISRFKNHKFWWIIDFLSIIPFDLLIYDGYISTKWELMALFRVVRLFEFPKIDYLFFHSSEKNRLINAGKTRLVNSIFWILLIIHFVACGWIFIDHLDKPMENYISIYIKAFYWTVTTFTTIGYGDITPSNDIEIIYTTMVMILGAGIYGYTIGNVAHLLSNIDAAKAHFNQKIEKISSYITYKKLAPNLQNKILGYYNYLWENRKGYDEDSVLADLPASLQMEIALHLNKNIFRKISLFDDANEEIINELAVKLKPVVYTPEDIIFQKGELGMKMYFISKGKVQVLNPITDEELITLTEGNFFGEIALTNSIPRTATVKAVDYCDLYTLDKETFESVIKKYPDFAQKVKITAAKRMEENKQKASKEN